jgi:SAM-dependent methyltransferase
VTKVFAALRGRRLRSRTDTSDRVVAVREASHALPTTVDRYWTGHTVGSVPFKDAAASEHHLQWRFKEYPLFREFSGLYGDHAEEVVLDYGCGPGNDLVGFALYSRASRVIGVDVSPTALGLAARRLALHRIGHDRVELVQTSDAERTLPLENSSIDHFSCQGVLHHVSEPEALLADAHRVLRPGGTGSVMVYNRDSVWWHLWTAYDRMIVDGSLAGLDVAEAFRRNTDGPECPISLAYRGHEFVAICESAGFRAEFVGGYLSRHELERMRASWAQAISDQRLASEHRSFLRELTCDFAGRPMYRGFHAGIGGTYRLRKPGR